MHPLSNEIPTDVRRTVNHRDEMRCQICGAIGSEIQHRMRRREGGHRLSNLIRICRIDHALVHAQPAWAMEHGFTISAVMTGLNPEAVPLWSYRGWVTYDDEGGVHVVAPRSTPSSEVARAV